MGTGMGVAPTFTRTKRLGPSARRSKTLNEIWRLLAGDDRGGAWALIICEAASFTRSHQSGQWHVNVLLAANHKAGGR